ncbi:MAG TPA: transposase [Vicinamibacterales bacterium]|nr:transposase [Vicinamibacterales bacterium]
MATAPEELRTQRLDLARRWRESGRSARAFAQEQGVSPYVLYHWRQQLTGEERATRRRPSRRVKLARVRVVAETAADLEIVLASGDRVRVATNTSADLLRRVVQVLRTGC